MRTSALLAVVSVAALAASPALADREAKGRPEGLEDRDIESSRAIAHALTPPIRDIVMPEGVPTGFNVEIPIRLRPAQPIEEEVDITPPNLQLEEYPVGGVSTTPSPILNFQGQSDDENATTVFTRIVPPDTVGDVGKTQYLQWINLIASVYNKSTGARVMGPVAGNAFFTGLGAPCATTNDGDPIVLYDQKNDRWVVSQFAPNSGVQCVAVSTSSDATGSYNAYAFSVGGFNDYPKLGLWLNNGRDALAATYRTFGGPGGGFSLDFQLMDYHVMLSGGSSPGQRIVRGGSSIEGCLPADVDGSTWAPNDKALFGCYEFGSSSNEFLLWTFDPNFPSGSGVFSTLPSVSFGTIDRIVGRIPQPSPGEALDSHASTGLDATMYRLPYRNRGGYEQLLATTTHDVGGDRAGIHFIELRNSGGGWSHHQDGSYAPGASLERWMGSIASDAAGNIAVGYSASSGSVIPSVRYTSRSTADPLGTLPGGEVTARAGGGVQTNSNNRWGDYSSMNVDPDDDCTFWYTQEYYANTGGFDFKTNIHSFKFPGCGAPATETLTVSLAGTGSGTAVSAPSGINCPGTCAASFMQGTVVDLFGYPATGSQLTGWSGAADCSDGSVTMNGPVSCTATFDICSGTSILSLPAQTVTTTKSWEACNIIEAGAGTGGFVVGSTGIVTMDAGNMVVLQNGFVVLSNGTYTAGTGQPVTP